jgi:hypothetical protein
MGEVRLDDNEAFLALGAPLPSAWVHGRPRVEELALPKSVESGNLSVNKAVIRRMSDKYGHEKTPFNRKVSTA